jgi:hypothetical protein
MHRTSLTFHTVYQVWFKTVICFKFEAKVGMEGQAWNYILKPQGSLSQTWYRRSDLESYSETTGQF